MNGATELPALEGLRQSGRLQAELQHPRILPVIDFFKHDDEWFSVFARIADAHSLHEIITSIQDDHRPPYSIAEFVAHSAGVTNGLAAIHRVGFVHRTLGTHNVLVDSHGHVLLDDLGCATPIGADDAAARAFRWFMRPASAAPEHASVNLWGNDEHAAHYLDRADTISHRSEGEAALLEWIPQRPSRLLDLGSGDGRLLSRVLDVSVLVEAVALDFSPVMLGRLRARFSASFNISITVHDLEEPLPQELGTFDVIVSSFAIHHLTHTRKRTLYGEVYSRLRPGGVFCNLEHVASPTVALHNDFLARLDVRPQDEDPSNKLLDVYEQLRWLRDVGFTDVDCHWKWRELALLAGRRS